MFSDIAVRILPILSMKRELNSFRNAFILVDIVMAILFYSVEILKNNFHKILNTLDVELKFTMEIGGNVFDLKISTQNNCLEATVYCKPTESHLYLEASSCHKKFSENGIIKGVPLRLRRVRSTMEDSKMK